jgi:hypothetical protein
MIFLYKLLRFTIILNVAKNLLFVSYLNFLLTPPNICKKQSKNILKGVKNSLKC